AQTLELTGLELTVADANLSGNLTGSEILDAPHIRGLLKHDPLALRTWLPKLGIEVPKTRDPKVLERLSFSGQVDLTESSVELSEVSMQLDETTLKGKVGVADFDAKALRFDLEFDRIDVDRYLPPPSEEPEAKAGDEGPTVIPVDMLR